MRRYKSTYEINDRDAHSWSKLKTCTFSEHKMYKILPIIITVLILCTFAFTSIYTAHASSFKPNKHSNWLNLHNTLNGSEDSLYPYNSDTASISKVSLNVLYGSSRDLVTYTGEFPYAQLYNEDEQLEAWNGYYASPGTDVTSDSNPAYGALIGSVSAADYWGVGLTADDFANPVTAEQINASDVVSLRLYASANTISYNFLGGLINIPYSLIQGISGVALSLLNVLVSAKNLDLNTIMDLLNLDNLSDTLTKNFIFDSENIRLSAFTAFCLIALVFSLVALGIKYALGKEKANSIWEIVGTVIISLLVIGMCLSGNISSLGSSVANMGSELVYSVVEALNSYSSGSAFAVSIEDDEHENEVTQISEMALINQTYIDLQICSQFGVNDIDDLKFANFGDLSGSDAKQYLAGLGSAVMYNDFNNNLGYYYWFANSSAVEKTHLNTTYPETNTTSAENKLSSIITYLQHEYNKPNISSANKENIKNVILSFAQPGASSNFITLLVFTVALFVLTFVLGKYGLNVLLAKIELFLALLAMALAGPLILTSNKKLVKSGKAILGMLVISFLELTIYSLVFDIIIYVIASILTTDISAIIVTLIILILLFKFNPYLEEKIRQLLENTASTISPEFVQNRRAFKNWSNREYSKQVSKFDNKEKVVGYDEDGNTITEKNEGNALSRVLHRAGTAVFETADTRTEAGYKSKEYKKIHQTNMQQTKVSLRQAEVAKIDRHIDEYKKDREKIKTETLEQIKLEKSLAYDDKTLEIKDTAQLSISEKKLVDDIEATKIELDKLNTNNDFQALREKEEQIKIHNAKSDINHQLQLSDTEQARLEDYSKQFVELSKQIDDTHTQLIKEIDHRIESSEFSKHDIDIDQVDGKSLSEKVDKMSKKIALDTHKQELEQSLKDAIDVMTEEVNSNEHVGKIGKNQSGRTFNKDAASAMTAAMIQLKQLESGDEISTTSDAKNIAENIVKQASKTRNTHEIYEDDHIVREGKLDAIMSTSGKQKQQKEQEYDEWSKEISSKRREEMQTIKSDKKRAIEETGRKLDVTNKELLQNLVDHAELNSSTTSDTKPVFNFKGSSTSTTTSSSSANSSTSSSTTETSTSSTSSTQKITDDTNTVTTQIPLNKPSSQPIKKEQSVTNGTSSTPQMKSSTNNGSNTNQSQVNQPTKANQQLVNQQNSPTQQSITQLNKPDQQPVNQQNRFNQQQVNQPAKSNQQQPITKQNKSDQQSATQLNRSNQQSVNQQNSPTQQPITQQNKPDQQPATQQSRSNQQPVNQPTKSNQQQINQPNTPNQQQATQQNRPSQQQVNQSNRPNQQPVTQTTSSISQQSTVTQTSSVNTSAKDSRTKVEPRKSENNEHDQVNQHATVVDTTKSDIQSSKVILESIIEDQSTKSDSTSSSSTSSVESTDSLNVSVTEEEQRSNSNRLNYTINQNDE